MKENFNVMAVFCDSNNQISHFNEMTHWIVYTKDESVWRESETIVFKPDLSGGIATIRESITSIIREFNTCKIIITKSLTGLPYQIFDQAGFIICESENFDLDLLNAIQSDLISIDEETNADELLLSNTPAETDEPGHYFIDLTKVQKKHPEMSSKMSLLPFLKDSPFYTLEVVCDHIPPWFDHKLPEMNLSYSIENRLQQNKNDSAKHVLITHVACEK